MQEDDITPGELVEMQKNYPDLVLVDVREPFEIDICAINNSCHIPLGELQKRYDEIPRNREVVVHCKLGGRSAKAVGNVENIGLYTHS